MTTNNPHDFLDPLQSVEKVEVSPFLFSRIEQKIQTLRENTISKKMVWTMVTSVSLIVIFNLFVITQSSWVPKENDNLLQSLQIQNNNSLYQ